jgi:phosphoglycolate phosphatase
MRGRDPESPAGPGASLAGRPSLVVFDLDGTLIDSIADLAVAVNRLVEERGGRRLDAGRVVGMVGEGAALLIARAFEASGVNGAPRETLPRFLEIYDSLLPGTTRPYPGVPEMVRALAAVVPLAVLTNKPAGAATKILSLLGLAPSFRQTIGGDGPYGRKPEPDGLRQLMAVAGVEARDTLMVGDSTIDLLTARAAGVRACLVRWGFGFAALDKTKLGGDEVFADAPSDVVALLLEGRHAG